MDAMEQYALTLTDDDTFDPAECDMVVEKFCCGVCHVPLNIVDLPNERRVLIVCVEHGNVCHCGRVTHATVSIQLEEGFRAYHEVIRNLPDLWGNLADAGIDYEKAHLIWKKYVCAVCGGLLTMQMRKDDPNANRINLSCISHGQINVCGYIKKEEYVYDFQRIREWEKNHRKNYSTKGA